MKKSKLNKKSARREFIKQMSTVALAVPLFNVLRIPRAHAATSVAPLRFISVHYPFHLPEMYYHPQNSTGGMAAAGSTFNLNFTNSILAPLAPFQSKINIFRGLCYGGGGGSSHTTTFASFTGASASATNKISIDQYLFSRIAPTGSLTPMAVGLDSAGDSMSFLGNVLQPVITDPAQVFSTYFTNFKGGSTGTGTSSAAAAILARRNKTFSIAQNGLTNFLGQLPGSTSATSASVLTQHQTALTGLSASLNASTTSASGASCAPPVASSIAADTASYHPNFSMTATDFTNFSTLITEAFACDITRIASIVFSGTAAQHEGIDKVMPGVNYTNPQGLNFHNGVTHNTHDNGSIYDQQMAAYQNYWFTCLAQLMTKLQATADPFNPSQSLLDNTVIYVDSEGGINQPDNTNNVHNGGHQDQGIILAGGCGGLFKMGQLIDVRSLGTVLQAKGIPHNALLTNIINAFEANQLAFNPAFVAKPLTQFGDFSFPVSASTWLS